MRNHFLISGICSLLALSAAAPSVAFAEAPAAAVASVEKGQMKLTIDGKSAAREFDPHSCDWSGSEAFGSAAISARFRKGDLEATGHSVLTATVGLNLEGGKVNKGEVVISLYDGGGHYTSNTEGNTPKISISSLKVNGSKLEVSGTIETKVFFFKGGSVDNSKSFEVAAEFSAELEQL